MSSAALVIIYLDCLLILSITTGRYSSFYGRTTVYSKGLSVQHFLYPSQASELVSGWHKAVGLFSVKYTWESQVYFVLELIFILQMQLLKNSVRDRKSHQLTVYSCRQNPTIANTLQNVKLAPCLPSVQISGDMPITQFENFYLQLDHVPGTKKLNFVICSDSIYQ